MRIGWRIAWFIACLLGWCSEALAAPIWGRYALFRGHPRITGLVMWDVHERQVVIANPRLARDAVKLLAKPRM